MLRFPLAPIRCCRAFLGILFLSVLVAGCGSTDAVAPRPDDASILALGDSVFDFYSDDEASIPDVIGEALGQSVWNVSVSGARLSYLDAEAAAEGLDIRAQYREGAWDWVVFDGGGNDLGDECRCGACDLVIHALIADDGRSGELPDFAAHLAQTGAQVVYVGYYDIPSDAKAFSDCGAEVDALNRRAERMASALEGVWYVWAGEVVTPDDRDAYAADGFHPSERGARLIGEHVAAFIESIEAGE